MVAANLKEETRALMDKRAAIEGEMNAIIARLTQPGGPGLSGNLVDSEGFPRSDIEVPQVRADRGRLSELRNDYEDITSKISQKLEMLHAARLAPKTAAPPKNTADGEESVNQVPNFVTPASASHEVHSKDTPSAIELDFDPLASVPFVMIDEIADASPAAEDGLQLGDQIVKFGNVTSADKSLHRLASEGQSNEGHAVPVVALRHGELINLTVTPRPWHGRGLLGCHFRLL